MNEITTTTKKAVDLWKQPGGTLGKVGLWVMGGSLLYGLYKALPYLITFTQNIDLQGGQYLVSFGVTGYKLDDFTVYHRLYDAMDITVISDKNTVGFFDTNSKIEIARK